VLVVVLVVVGTTITSTSTNNKQCECELGVQPTPPQDGGTNPQYFPGMIGSLVASHKGFLAGFHVVIHAAVRVVCFVPTYRR